MIVVLGVRHFQNSRAHARDTLKTLNGELFIWFACKAKLFRNAFNCGSVGTFVLNSR